MSKTNRVLLEARGLTRAFGGIRAVDGLSFEARSGEITGLIGPNGAGKTTVFNLITAVYRPTSGAIILDGSDISKLKPYEVVRAGVARTFQNIRLFGRMTCIQNVMTPIMTRGSCGPIASVFRTRAVRREEEAARARAIEIMSDMGIEESAERQASTLPYGLQRKLEMARALACGPKLLLLDEPAAGMNDAETKELGETIKRVLSGFGVTVILIEHHINLVMDICSHVVVMERGALLASGGAAEIRENPRVIEAYLGNRGRSRGWAKTALA